MLEVSEALGIEPEIGVRAKLSTRAQGHWADTAGDRGKFGLNATQMIDAVNTLKEVRSGLFTAHHSTATRRLGRLLCVLKLEGVRTWLPRLAEWIFCECDAHALAAGV